MREIKFRAWDKKEKEMIGEVFTRHLIEDYDGDELNTVLSNNKRFELMQYTGLKDIDKTEVYESDLIEYLHSFDLWIKTEVEYKWGSFMINNRAGNWEHLGDFSKIRVIGNIWEDK